MSFSERAVHTLEGNETAIGVTDCHAYVNGQVMCLSQGGVDGLICFGKGKRHVDGLVQGVLESCSCFQLFHSNIFGRRPLRCGVATYLISTSGQSRRR
jgi:hypothetical protein